MVTPSPTNPQDQVGDTGWKGGGTHSHFSQQLPLLELTPLLLTQLLSLPALDQLEPPLHLVVHTVHLP